MGYIQSAHEPIGLAFSIVGLAIVIPTVFLFMQYFRFLDHIQLTYLYWKVLASSSNAFGSDLDESWAKFIPNFLSFLNSVQIIRQLGFALSFTICLLGVVILLFFIVQIQKCKKPHLRFQPVYSLFKGFFRWTYIPLAYGSAYFLVQDIKLGKNQNLIPAIIILAFTVIFPTAQLIAYKVAQQQKDRIWIKWFQFFGYMRHFLIALILVFGQVLETDQQIAKFIVYVPLTLYAGLFLWKGTFIYKILQRVLFGVGEAIAITIFSLYLFAPTELTSYELDFIGLSVILLLDLTVIIIRLVSWLVYGKVDVDKVNPEQEEANQNELQKRQINNSIEVLEIDADFKIKKKNKYDESDDLQNSRDQLVNVVKRGNQRRRRQ